MAFVSLLSRRTSGNRFIPEIDGFRFFAISTVLVYHFNTQFYRTFGESDFFHDNLLGKLIHLILHQGSVGVDVFFAISGFILALPFAVEKLSNSKPILLKDYYLRRVTRLEPPYVISLILLLIVAVIVVHKPFESVFPNFLASLFYVHNIVYDSWSEINPVAWSLEVEVQFYILAPFIARAIFSMHDFVKRRIVLIALIVLGILNYNFNYEIIETLHLRKSILMHMHQFLIGFLFADFFLTDWNETLNKKNYIYDVLGVAALLILFLTNTPFSLIRDFAFEGALFISFVCVFKGKLFNKFFTNQWIVVIGGMCYSIYLLHYALMAFLMKSLKSLYIGSMSYELNFLLLFVAIMPIVLLAGAAFFVFIERPCMDKNWPEKLRLRFRTLFGYTSS